MVLVSLLLPFLFFKNNVLNEMSCDVVYSVRVEIETVNVFENPASIINKNVLMSDGNQLPFIICFPYAT